VVNASNIDKDWDWISSHNDLGVEMKNLSDDYSLLAIQGPKAVEAMQSLTSVDLSVLFPITILKWEILPDLNMLLFLLRVIQVLVDLKFIAKTTK
jgi:glycine cleavage system aminomethyltransferase T